MNIKNKYVSKKEQLKLIWLGLLKEINNPKLEKFLNTLLSQYEKDIISNRLAALSLIKQGKTYREIGKELWLSSTTISSLKSIVKGDPNTEYKTHRQIRRISGEKIEEEKKNKYYPEPSPFFDTIDSIFNKIPRKTGFRGTRRF